jgi:hypothetical protein
MAPLCIVTSPWAPHLQLGCEGVAGGADGADGPRITGTGYPGTPTGRCATGRDGMVNLGVEDHS